MPTDLTALIERVESGALATEPEEFPYIDEEDDGSLDETEEAIKRDRRAGALRAIQETRSHDR